MGGTKGPHYDAFVVLLTECLKTHTADDLLVIFDESLDPLKDSLVDAVTDHGLLVSFLEFPERYQEWLVSSQAPEEDIVDLQLPHGLLAAISSSSAIINATSGELATAKFRRAIIDQARTKGCRLAHIPGIDAEVLELLGASPILEIENDCELVGWALGEADKAELHTRDRLGRSHTLALQLEGWRNPPILSTGVIQPGSWGNLPPGEVFCCPTPGGVSGEVVIDGSLHGAVLQGADEALLIFEEGRLVGWLGEPASPVIAFCDEQALKGAARGDENWKMFAEFGVGLNPAIASLTGNSLFDEKAFGTTHIALGDNFAFGHPIQSDIHADLVIVGSELVLDNHLVVAPKVIHRDVIEEWRRGHEPEQHPVSVETHVLLKSSAIVQSADGRLMRRLTSGRRLGAIEIAREATATALRVLSECMLTDVWTASDELRISLRKTGEVAEERLPELLGILKHYEMIQIREGSDFW